MYSPQYRPQAKKALIFMLSSAGHNAKKELISLKPKKADWATPGPTHSFPLMNSEAAAFCFEFAYFDDSEVPSITERLWKTSWNSCLSVPS